MKASQKPNSGYHLRDVPAPDSELTHTCANTPMGELMRRFWQPVCLASELTDVPLAIRILGEDLVAFRDRGGRVGVLARHCAHRGASLEFGIIADRGLRCCYHGWLFDTDGTVLETPGEPPHSPLKDMCMQGAYPVREYRGLIFAYMGPPEQLPEFPILDTYDAPNNRMVPYSAWYPCNWLQVKENFVDPAHAYFLHSNITTVQFSDAWAQLPTYDFAETPDGQGMYYITGRRVEDRVWVRSNHIWLPNVGQVAALLEKAEAEKFFHRVSITRWTMPIDDMNCWIIGWRHFNDEVDPFHEGKPEECGRDAVDFYGQTGHRSYEQKQRIPGDWDAQVGQRPIAVHKLEHLGTTDLGVVMWRRLLRKAVRGQIDVAPQMHAAEGVKRTYTHDTVLRIPQLPGQNENLALKAIGREVLARIIAADDVPLRERTPQIRRHLEELRDTYNERLIAAG